MKYFLLSLFLFPIYLSGQGYSALQQDIDSIYLELGATDGKLGISYQIPSNNSNKKDLLNIIELKLSDADLILHYNLNSKIEKDFYYTVEALFLSEAGAVIQSNLNTTQGDLGRIYGIYDRNKGIMWRDATEKLLEYNKKYVLVINTKLWGIFNCDEPRPRFTLNQQYPYYLAAISGFSIIAVGQTTYTRRDLNYHEYNERWKNGESQDAAQSFLDDAQKAERNAKTLTYVGWAVIGLDAAGIIYRIIKTKKDQKLYDEYCAKKDVTWNISPGAAPDVTGSGQLGATLSIRF